MSTSTTIQSPDGKYAVEQQADYGEIGMGSPAFGHIAFRGADVQFPDYLFGEAVVFSLDSRFVALEQLVETRPFRTKLIAVELPRGTVHFIRLQPQGTATPRDGSRPRDFFIEFGRSVTQRRFSLGTRHPQRRPQRRKVFSVYGDDA